MNLVDIKEVSKILKVKESTLYSWAGKGLIPSHKLNGLLRFDVEEIEEWVKESKQNTANLNIPALKISDNQNINMIIKKAIDNVKGSVYTSSIGKPGQKQGLRREV